MQSPKSIQPFAHQRLEQAVAIFQIWQLDLVFSDETWWVGWLSVQSGPTPVVSLPSFYFWMSIKLISPKLLFCGRRESRQRRRTCWGSVYWEFWGSHVWAIFPVDRNVVGIDPCTIWLTALQAISSIFLQPRFAFAWPKCRRKYPPGIR